MSKMSSQGDKRSVGMISLVSALTLTLTNASDNRKHSTFLLSLSFLFLVRTLTPLTIINPTNKY